jgi:hypothetical protein
MSRSFSSADVNGLQVSRLTEVLIRDVFVWEPARDNVVFEGVFVYPQRLPMVCLRIRSIVAALVILVCASSVGLPDEETGEVSVPESLSRQKLDETVWEDEIVAQRYEQVFVRLWDRLRESKDKLAVLASLPLESLSYGKPGTREVFDLSIERRRYEDQETERLNRQEFQAELRRLKGEGYTIEQTEWHHSQFVRGKTGESPRSVVSTALHAVRRAAKTEHRMIIRANLHIVWEAESSGAAEPAIKTIAAKNVRVFRRTGPPAFQERFKIAGGRGTFLSAHPILVYDLDGDGRSEIILPRWNQVYWNHGRGQFGSAKLTAKPQQLWEAAILADFTGDGLPDLVSVSKKGNIPVLYSGGTREGFESEAARCAEVAFELPSAMTAGDIDGDGDLDLFATQYKRSYVDGQMPTPYYDANDGFPSYLLVNDGSGRFSDATIEAGLGGKRFRRCYSSSFVDLDEDGDLDLMVVSDFAGIDLYENQTEPGGRIQFSEATGNWVGGRHLFGMAHTFGDYNLDGELDFYAIGMSSTTARRLDSMKLTRNDRPEVAKMRAAMGYGNRMYLKRGNRFEAPDFAPSVARTGWSWGTTSFDFDNDGDSDIYVANGNWSGKSSQDYCTRYWCHDVYTGTSLENSGVKSLLYDSLVPLNSGDISWNGYEKNTLLLNDGGKDFVNVAYLLGVSFEYDSRAVISDDLDGDGRPDLLVARYKYVGKGAFEMTLHVYGNTLRTKNHWIGVKLREEGGGVSPIGAKVLVRSSRGVQTARIVTGDSFLSQHANAVHFGLGEVDKVASIEIVWPNGKKRTIPAPAVDRYHR